LTERVGVLSLQMMEQVETGLRLVLGL